MKRASYGVLAALFAVFGALMLIEWFSAGPLASEQSISAYHFGSESMLAHGGRTYESAELYAGICGVESLIFFGVAGLFSYAAAKKKDQFAVAAGVAWLAVFVSNHLIG